MAKQEDLISGESVDLSRVIRAKEPLYSMLMYGQASAVRYLYEKLLDFSDNNALDDVYPEVSLTRREYIEQVQIAMRDRGMI